MSLFPVFTRDLALKLEMQGFSLIKIAPNKKKPEHNVYYFEDTLAVHRAFFEILHRKKESLSQEH